MIDASEFIMIEVAAGWSVPHLVRYFSNHFNTEPALEGSKPYNM